MTFGERIAYADRVYINHPEFKNFDTAKYKEGQSIRDGDYYCTIKEKERKYFFKYAYVQYDLPYNNFIEIALTSGTQYGESLNLAKDIGFLKKRKYRKLFEKYFIDEVLKEVRGQETPH